MCLPTFLDTGPDIDDAVATAAAIFVSELDLQLMTTVAGNVSVEKITRNILQLLHFWNAETPFVQRTAVPLVYAPRDAAFVHGKSGMADYDFVEHNRKPLGIPTFLVIRDALIRTPEPVTLVAIDLLTNIVLLLSQCPECKPCTHHLMIIGGSAGRGDCTSSAEFNTVTDPEATACVFRSGTETVTCGLDVTNQVMLTPDYLSTPPQLSRAGRTPYALLSHYRSGSTQSGLRMHDLYTIAWLVRPNPLTLKPHLVAVKTQDEFTSGTTVVDIDGCPSKSANVQVALDLGVKGFQQWMAGVLAPTS